MRPRCVPSFPPPSPKDNAHATLNPARRACSQPRWLHPPRHQYSRRFLVPFTGRSSSSDRLSAAERGRCQGDPRTGQVRGLGLGGGPPAHHGACSRWARAGERTLRIVFPAHVDGSGTLHDEAVAWTVVEAARWAGELRRDEVGQPKGTMRALRQALKEQARRASDAAVNPMPLSPEDSAPAIPANPFLPSSPLALPSPGGEAQTDVTTPVPATSAAEGSDMSPTPHVRAPRPLEGKAPHLAKRGCDRKGQGAQAQSRHRAEEGAEVMALSLRALRDRLLAGLLGDAEQTEAVRPMLMLDMLSDWLPYRVYDPASRLYVNARSKGFVLGGHAADRRRRAHRRDPGAVLFRRAAGRRLPPGPPSCKPADQPDRRAVVCAALLQGGVYEAIARHRASRLYGWSGNQAPDDAPFHARASPGDHLFGRAGVQARSATRN
jgi:hypothetical protein